LLDSDFVRIRVVVKEEYRMADRSIICTTQIINT